MDALTKAAAMLDIDGENIDAGRLDHSLIKEITVVDDFCKNGGGRLVSRQAIAIIIMQWQKEHPDDPAYL